MTNSKQLTNDQCKVLLALPRGQDWWDGVGYLPFAPISEATGLPRARVRRACRALARKGLARYGRGLWTEAGRMAGAGYALTKEGLALAEKLADEDV